MINTGSNLFVKIGLYKADWRLAVNRQTSIDAGRPTTKKWVDSIVFSKDATFDEMVAKAFPGWDCANTVGGTLPVPTDDTLTAQDKGYGSYNVLWSLLDDNDSITGAFTIGDITDLTPGLCTAVNNVGSSSVDVTEVSGSPGNCQWTYTVTDTVGTSVQSARTFTQINSTGGETTPPALASPNDGAESTNSDVGGDITVAEPAGTVQNDYLLAVQDVESNTIPTLNTNYIDICTASGDGLSVRFFT